MSAGRGPSRRGPSSTRAAASAAAVFRSLPVAPRRLRVDPGLEGRGVEAVEEEQQVREVALRVDRDHGDALAQQLLEEDDGEAGLARSRHADDEPVGQQVGGIEIQAVAERAAFGIDLLAEIEPVAHTCLPVLFRLRPARRSESGWREPAECAV